jgi:hypothetical protein
MENSVPSKRSTVAQRAPPLPRGASGVGLLDVPELLDIVLKKLTLQEAGRLGCTCNELARIVRDTTRVWKPSDFARKIDCSWDQCYSCDVIVAFGDAYAFFREEDLSPYADWLLKAVCEQDSPACERWNVFRGCIRIETRQDEEGEDEMWIVQPNTPTDIIASNMQKLNEVIVEKCLQVVSPSCWQSWKPEPTWCDSVRSAFDKWRVKLPFAINENRIDSDSILGRISEYSFERVKRTLNVAVKGGKFRTWNHFARALLTECYKYDVFVDGEEYDDDYGNVNLEFEQDEGDGYVSYDDPEDGEDTYED